MVGITSLPPLEHARGDAAGHDPRRDGVVHDRTGGDDAVRSDVCHYHRGAANPDTFCHRHTRHFTRLISDRRHRLRRAMLPCAAREVTPGGDEDIALDRHQADVTPGTYDDIFSDGGADFREDGPEPYRCRPVAALKDNGEECAPQVLAQKPRPESERLCRSLEGAVAAQDEGTQPIRQEPGGNTEKSKAKCDVLEQRSQRQAIVPPPSAVIGEVTKCEKILAATSHGHSLASREHPGRKSGCGWTSRAAATYRYPVAAHKPFKIRGLLPSLVTGPLEKTLPCCGRGTTRGESTSK